MCGQNRENGVEWLEFEFVSSSPPGGPGRVWTTTPRDSRKAHLRQPVGIGAQEEEWLAVNGELAVGGADETSRRTGAALAMVCLRRGPGRTRSGGQDGRCEEESGGKEGFHDDCSLWMLRGSLRTGTKTVVMKRSG